MKMAKRYKIKRGAHRLMSKPKVRYAAMILRGKDADITQIKDCRGRTRNIYRGTARIPPTRYAVAHDGGEGLAPIKWDSGHRPTAAEAKAGIRARAKRKRRAERNQCIAAGVSNTALIRLAKAAYPKLGGWERYRNA
jgi:hypothetical protein